MKNRLLTTFLWAIFFMSTGTLLHAMEVTRPIAEQDRRSPVRQRRTPAQNMLIPGLVQPGVRSRLAQERIMQRPPVEYGRLAARRRAVGVRMANMQQEEPMRPVGEQRERERRAAWLRRVPVHNAQQNQRLIRLGQEETYRFFCALSKAFLNNRQTPESQDRYKKKLEIAEACLDTGLVNPDASIREIPVMFVAASLGEPKIVAKLLGNHLQADNLSYVPHNHLLNRAFDYAIEADDYLSAALFRVATLKQEERRARLSQRFQQILSARHND